MIIICGSYYSSKKTNALLALLLHCKHEYYFFRPIKFNIASLSKKVQPLTLLDTFLDKKIYPFCLLFKKMVPFHLPKVSTKKVSSTESARVQKNSCPIAGGWWILLSGWWILFLTCPMGKWSVLGHSIHRRTVINLAHPPQKCFGLVKVILGLVNASCRLTQWRAVKLTFFAPCECCFLLLACPTSLPMLFISVILHTNTWRRG